MSSSQASANKLHALRAITLGYLAFALWIVVYAANRRTFIDFLLYSTYIAIPLILASASLLNSTDLAGRGNRTLRRFAAQYGSIVVVNYIIATVCYSAYVSVANFSDWISTPTWTKADDLPVVVLAAMLVALLLFVFRLTCRAMYGLSEIATGIGIIVHKTVSDQATLLNQDQGFFLAILTAGIYLMVRGMDNVHQGITKEPLDPLFNLFLRIVAR